MPKALGSLLLFLILIKCRTTLEELRPTEDGSPPHPPPPPPPASSLPPLPQQDVDAVNALFNLSAAPRGFKQSISPTDCCSRKFGPNLNFYYNRSTNICRVAGLDLQGLGLSGQIPASIGNLAYLKSLDLSGNDLTGSIPESFRNLSHLSEIDLYNNMLEGPLPRFLSEMKSVELLDLSNNFFNDSIPREFGTFPVLQYLYLDDNFLSNVIPIELGNISRLEALSTTDNELSGQLPQQLGNLTYLEELYLENNLFHGELPPSFEKLKNLEIITVQGDNFSGKIPTFISKWQNLEVLVLCGNNFEAPIPDAISELTNLKILVINDLVGADEQSFPKIHKLVSLTFLSLRKCSLNGPIPEYIWGFKSLNYLDLSFNNFTGGIPPAVNVKYNVIYLRSNHLDGSLPVWLKDSPIVDVSENLFTDVTITRDAALSNKKNFFSCCSKTNNEDMKWLEANYSCHSESLRNEEVYINCGGEATEIDGKFYEADLELNGASTFHLSKSQTWGFSSMGVFVDAENQNYMLNKPYTLNKTCNISDIDDPSLYLNARVSPISLKYYAFCLKNQRYKVTLHFAEIGWDVSRDPTIKRHRVFDIEIQNVKKKTDFNIEVEAGGVNKNRTLVYDVAVHNNRLEIHLYWAGKGSVTARKAYYGPLISVISISPVIKEHHKLSSASIIGIVGSAILSVILILALFWKLGWLGGRKNEDQKGIELFPGGVFNFQQIKTATNNFHLENKIGGGGFGFVYKGVLPNGTRVAVKKLSAKSKQGAREFINEIGTTYALQHPNLIKLMGCCAEQSELLLIYEYMENNSLENALFGSAEVKSRLNWLIRVKICRDVAKGLAFIHEDSKLRIVHRDIKPTNILLDKDFTAKISDFGFAKHDAEENSHVTTRIAGTTGYMAPEYMQGFLTPKADVYSFGIVTLEIVSGKNISTFRPKDQNVYLLDTAYDYQRQGNLIALVDSCLGSEYTYNEALKLLNLAMECVSPAPKLRPAMSEVVKVLEGIVKVVERKWKRQTKSTGNPSSVDDAAMNNLNVGFSQSTLSTGSTSQEGTSDTINTYPSTSKEIDDLSNVDDQDPVGEN